MMGAAQRQGVCYENVKSVFQGNRCSLPGRDGRGPRVPLWRHEAARPHRAGRRDQADAVARAVVGGSSVFSIPERELEIDEAWAGANRQRIVQRWVAEVLNAS